MGNTQSDTKKKRRLRNIRRETNKRINKQRKKDRISFNRLIKNYKDKITILNTQSKLLNKTNNSLVEKKNKVYDNRKKVKNIVDKINTQRRVDDYNDESILYKNNLIYYLKQGSIFFITFLIIILCYSMYIR